MLEVEQELGKACIKVVGVGGGGNNAVNRMIESGIDGVEFIVINTDAQVLTTTKAITKVQIGEKLTKGLGAGGKPEIGEQAALESKEAITEALKGADLVFVTAGMGGGTGTGAAPIVAACAKENGALVVAVVTKPFKFEGGKRMRQAESGIKRLRESVDTAVIIPNEKLRDISNKNTTLVDSFKMADISLTNGVEGLVGIIVKPGLINLDFADVSTVIRDSGTALMGVGVASGENAIENATNAALNSPFLETTIEGATGAVVCVAGAESVMTVNEVVQAGDIVGTHTTQDANVIFGATIDDSLGDSVKVTIIVTGFSESDVNLLNILDSDKKLPEKTEQHNSEIKQETVLDGVEEATEDEGDKKSIFVKPKPRVVDIPVLPHWLRRKN